jgi:hypothetical protein
VSRALATILLSAGLLGPFHTFPPGEVALLEAVRDNTLIEDPGGALSNGSGPGFFVGRTNQPVNSIRRGVLLFELEGVLPPGAVVEHAALILHASSTNAGTQVVRIHRLLEDWGEGASSSTGGQGAPAATGDATWIHTFFDDETWRTPGGHRAQRASGRATVKTTGPVRSEGPGLARDVQLWLDQPGRNHGWILIGNESLGQTVNRFESRDSPQVDLRPRLEVTYRLPHR